MNEAVQRGLISLWNSSVERCGYVMDTGEILEAKNIASDPARNFCMDIEDLIEIFCGRDPRKVAGIFHTHPSNSSSPSKTDIHGWPGSKNLRYWIVTNDGVFEWEKNNRGAVRPVYFGSPLASEIHSPSEREGQGSFEDLVGSEDRGREGAEETYISKTYDQRVGKEKSVTRI